MDNYPQCYLIIPQAKLPRNIAGYFIYKCHQELQPNDLVKVEFRKKEVLGIVKEKSDCKAGLSISLKTKPVLSIIDQAPDYFVHLIQWVGEYYFVSPSFVFEMITPALLRMQTKPTDSIQIGQNFKNLKVERKQLELMKKILCEDLGRCSNINTYHLSASAKIITYIKLIEKNLKNNQQTILLLPTKDDLSFLLSYLPPAWQDKTAVLSSDIYSSKTQHWHQWSKILTGKAEIVCGTRSAIFAPCKNLGMILIDQAEKDEYKQYDQNPRYDTRRVALKISELTGCGVMEFSDGLIL